MARWLGWPTIRCTDEASTMCQPVPGVCWIRTVGPEKTVEAPEALYGCVDDLAGLGGDGFRDRLGGG